MYLIDNQPFFLFFLCKLLIKIVWANFEFVFAIMTVTLILNGNITIGINFIKTLIYSVDIKRGKMYFYRILHIYNSLYKMQRYNFLYIIFVYWFTHFSPGIAKGITVSFKLNPQTKTGYAAQCKAEIITNFHKYFIKLSSLNLCPIYYSGFYSKINRIRHRCIFYIANEHH